MVFVQKSILNKIYKKRDNWSHKGQYGKLLVIAGSERHTGSAIFVSMAAYRAGCDLVYLVGLKRPMDVAANYSPLFITQPLEGKQLEPKHVNDILSMIKEVRAAAVAIGPGLWRKEETWNAIIELVEKIEVPMVIDADAVRALSKSKEMLFSKQIVLTPHDNEFLELFGKELPRDKLSERIEIAKKEAYGINFSGSEAREKSPVTILLKGHVDVITDGTKVELNRTGSTKMTVGGMGDTLTGICGAYLARGIDTFTSACAAAFVNGKAGENAVKKYQEGAITTDLIKEIPNAIKKGK